MLRPMDVQQILLQSTAVEKIQQAQQHPDLQQKYLAMQLSEQRKILQARVNNADEADSVHLREKEDQPRQRRPSKEHQDARKEEEPGGGSEEGQKIDIVV